MYVCNKRDFIAGEVHWAKGPSTGRKSAILRTLLPWLLIVNVNLMAWASTVCASLLVSGVIVLQNFHKSRKTNSPFPTFA